MGAEGVRVRVRDLRDVLAVVVVVALRAVSVREEGGRVAMVGERVERAE